MLCRCGCNQLCRYELLTIACVPGPSCVQQRYALAHYIRHYQQSVVASATKCSYTYASQAKGKDARVAVESSEFVITHAHGWCTHCFIHTADGGELHASSCQFSARPSSQESSSSSSSSLPATGQQVKFGLTIIQRNSSACMIQCKLGLAGTRHQRCSTCGLR